MAAADTIKWARTPPSASWRFESGRERRDERRDERRRSPRRRSLSPPRRGGRDGYSPRKDERDRRDRDYDRRDRDRGSRTPDDRERDRDRDMKDAHEREEERENGTNGDDRKGKDWSLEAYLSGPQLNEIDSPD